MPPAATLAVAIAAVAVVTAVDTAVSSRLPLSILSLATVVYVAWRQGARQGAIVAATAAVGRVVADVTWNGLDIVTAWNALAWSAAMAAAVRAGSWGRARRQEVDGLEARVAELLQIEHSFARTDPLTALSNRRAFVDALQRAEARGRRNGSSVAVVRIDLDSFSQVNSLYSRQEGDQLLRAVATSLSLTTRMGDLASRLDSDEFALLLYSCQPEDALRVAERVLAEIVDLGRAYPDAGLSASIGIACFAAPGPDPDEMMRLAGSALRRARQAGGNQVMIEREWTPDQLRELRPFTARPDDVRSS